MRHLNRGRISSCADTCARQVVHHPHHPGLQARAQTAEQYENKLGKDSKGHPLPKQARKVCP